MKKKKKDSPVKSEIGSGSLAYRHGGPAIEPFESGLSRICAER